MANKTLFLSFVGKLLPRPDPVNEAGGAACRLSVKGALAQYAATGCLSGTYYASAGEQLEHALALAANVDADFVAKTAVYARERAFMKDMPALLLAHLSVREPDLFARAFPRVVTDARMLRTFVEILRSDAVGRKSLGSRPKRLVRAWLASRDGDQVFRASVGRDQSLADIVKMVHPKPGTAERRALYGYLLGKAHDAALLPFAGQPRFLPPTLLGRNTMGNGGAAAVTLAPATPPRSLPCGASPNRSGRPGCHSG